jgi:hypothetical protein
MREFTQHINQISKDLDVNKKGSIVDPGPYEATIMNASDTIRTGRIDVYIPALGGPINSTDSWYTVRYAQPYFGKTNKDLIDKQESSGLHSYGMWMSPPDPGTKVVVTFMEGLSNKGIVIGCIVDDITNFMCPGLPCSKYWVQTPEVSELFPAYQVGKDFLPVIEYNPKVKRDVDNKAGVIERPVNIPLAKILKEQGLIGDSVRGLSHSTSQREANSSVYGINTPGRQANSLDSSNETVGRKPGHMFVMDDGDDKGKSNQMRMRTSTGHQILMDDDAGIIYVATASGNAWIEMTNNGNIHVYGKQSLSIHTEGSFNVHAGGNINLNSQMGINVLAEGNGGIKVEAKEGSYNVSSKTGINQQVSEGGLDVKTAGDQKFTATDHLIHHNGPEAGDAEKPSPNDLLTANGNRDVTSSVANIVPEHEPWNRGD